MKKLFTTIIIILSICANTSFGAEIDYGQKGIINFIQTKALEKTISTILKKKLGGNISTEITSYGAKGLRNGYFEKAHIQAENINYKNINISQIKATTTSAPNQIIINDKKFIPQTKIYANYSAELDNKDIESIVKSEYLQAKITKINEQISPLARISDLNVYIKDNHLIFKIPIQTFIQDATITFSTNILAQNGSTTLSDITTNKNLKRFISGNLNAILESINPVDILLDKVNNSKVNFSVKNINIINDKIQISGIIRIYKD